MPIDKLTDAKCRAAKPQAKGYKLFDGLGLALVVLPTGAKVWRLFYRHAGAQRTMSLGAFPEVGLAEARRHRDTARATMRDGADPMAQRKRKPDVPTLRAACDAYWQGRKDVTEGYRSNALRGLEMHIWPTLGNKPINEVTRDGVLTALTAMDAKGLHVYVRRVRVWLGQVLAQAVELKHCELNVCATIDPKRAFGRALVEHHAAIDLTEVPALMERLNMERELQSVLACKLLALTWVRTAELRMMRWAEIDGDLWRIPAGKMKRRRDHLVPLSQQSLAILAKLRARTTSDYVFPSDRRDDRPMSENSVLYMLGRIGYKGKMSGHGWRTIGSTWANEAGYSPDAIERQLAHAPDDKTRSAYNRAEFMPERVKMVQAFADWLMPES